MTPLALTKTIHLVCFVLLLFASGMKNWLLQPAHIGLAEIARVRRFDKLSAAMAGMMVLSGLALLLWLAKPTGSHGALLFWFKLGILIVTSVLVVMSKRVLRQALDQTTSTWVVPQHIRWYLRVDFIGILTMAYLGYSLSSSSF